MSSAELTASFTAYTTAEEVTEVAEAGQTIEAATWTVTASSVPCVETAAGTIALHC